MAVPQQRKSKSRRDMRRSQHDKITLPNVAICDNCGADVLPHRACASCGWYAGRIAVDVKSRDEDAVEELEE